MNTRTAHAPLSGQPAVQPPTATTPLRIAFVTETYPPEVNGVALTMARVVLGLHGRGHSVQLVRPRQAPSDVADTRTGFHEVLMRGLPIPGYPELRMGLPAKRRLLELWTAQPPDVVHIATEGPLGWSALQAARQLKLPVSSDFRTNFQAYSQHYKLGWFARPIMVYLRKFHNQADCTMVPTQALMKELQFNGFKGVSVVSRGVDTVRFAPQKRSALLRQGWGVQEHDLVVMCVGRLAAEKNLALLVKAFQAIEAAQPRAKLVLVGDGPLRAQLQALCPSAVFAGQRSADDLAAHYASADLFLFASMTETFGNVTTEAMASGLPVAAYDHAAAKQLIRSGVNGLLAPFGDAEAFVRHAVDLACQETLRKTLGVKARLTAEALDWDAVALRFEEVLAGVLRRCPQDDERSEVLWGHPQA